MDYEGFASASIAAVKTAIGNQSYDVLWQNSWEAGNMRADNYCSISIQNDTVQTQHLRLVTTGSSYKQVQWTNHNITLQFSFSSLNQTPASSSLVNAKRVRETFALDTIQDIFAGANASPHTPSAIVQVDERNDKERFQSEHVFELSFNLVTTASIDGVLGSWVDAVEYTGSVYGVDGVVTTLADYVTAAFSGAVAPIEDFTGVMDEALIPFNWESEKTQSFTFVFEDVPDAVVLSVYDDPENSGGVFLQGVTYTSESLSIEASAPFTGSVRYRAIWSDLSPSYPVTITSSLDVASGTLSGSARSLHASGLTGDPRVNWTSYWTALDETPDEFYITYWSNGKEGPIPVINVNGFDNEDVSGSIAAPILSQNNTGGKFDHIAFVSGS